MIALLALALQTQASVPAPKRSVSDPGVIATGQRVTPAGLQSVFEGRVGGVRFGRSSSEIWVATPGAATLLDWRANRVIASAPMDGRPGIYAVTTDRATDRVYMSSVGRLGSPPVGQRDRRPSVAQLSAFAIGASTIKANSGALGDYMAGAPAVAARANSTGRRVAVLPLPANDRLLVLDADGLTPLDTIELGVEPIAAAISDDGATAWVSLLGGAKPTAAQRQAMQCCDPRAEALRVDARGIAEPGSVVRVDLVAGRVVAEVPAARHPTALAWDQKSQRLYVSAGNDDRITIVDTRRDSVAGTISVEPFRSKLPGLAPSGLALSPDGRTLFATLGGANAVAVYDVSGSPRLRGLIPTGWYPTTMDVSPDGKSLAVGSLLGVGSGDGEQGGLRGRYVHAVRGAVNVIPMPTDAELAAFTVAVSQNNRLALASTAAPAESNAAAPARAVPARIGDPSLIDHVVMIVRENRTYDQVMGDLGRGKSDSSLVMYGNDVTPNAHALAKEFVTFDHFFASGGNSADGHQWLTQANETDYPMWPLYSGRSYPSEGEDALTYSSGGFLWENAQNKGKSVVVFGEYAPSPKVSSSAYRMQSLRFFAEHPKDYAAHRAMLRERYHTKSDIPSLDKALVREYPGWTEEVADVIKAGDILSHLAAWDSAGAMPNLVMIILPSDHTQGTSADWCAPKACVADNDLALGMIVEGLTHSRFWKSMAIFAVEDDAQNGVDHVDGHRTVALAMSPYLRRGIVDSTFYVQPGLVKTIELMLGLPSMSIFDLVATDMRAAFIGDGERPDFGAYTAVQPAQSLMEVNQRPGSIRGANAAARRDAALASARMILDRPDEAPTEKLNRILWHDARGWSTPYPKVQRSLFFPMSVDIPDDDREVKKKP
jgi:DNA-binding beta-propeller fold protein YncE